MADKGLYNLLIDLRANVSNLQRDMDSAVGILQRSTGKMAGVMRGFFEGLGRSLSDNFIGNIKQLSNALVVLADKGEEVGSIAENFKNLGGSANSIDAARKAVLGTVSAFDLMKVANEGIARGIPNLNKNFATLSEYAGRFADATGRDTLEVLQQLTTAISTGSNKALMEFGIQVDASGTRAQKMAQALEQLQGRMGNFAELTDSVSNAHKSFQIAIDDAMKSVGMGINENEQLTEVYRSLAEAVNSIDWKAVGADIASMVASVASVLPSLQTIAGEINRIATGVRAVTGNSTTGEKMSVAVSQYNAQIQELERKLALQNDDSAIWGITDSILGVDREASRKALEDQIANAKEFRQRALDEIQRDMTTGDPAVFPLDPKSDPGYSAWQRNKSGGGFSPGGGGGGRSLAIDREAEKRKKLEEDLYKEKQKQTAALLQGEYNARQRQEQAIAKQREQGVNNLQGVFQSLLSSDLVGLDSQFSGIAANFATELVSGLFSELNSKQGGIAAVGQNIAAGFGSAMKYLFGDSSTNMTSEQAHAAGIQGPAMSNGMFSGSNSGGFLGAGMTGDEAHNAGIQGPAQQDGSFGGGEAASSGGGTDYASYAGYVQQAAANLQQVENTNYEWGKKGERQKLKDQIHSVGIVVANAWTFGLASVVEGLVGRENMEKISIGVRLIDAIFGEHESTTARKAFDRWIEKALEGKNVSFLNKDGKAEKFTNLETQKFTETFTNKPGWADEFNKTPGASVFGAIGESLKDLLGITQDIGGQIGYILSENLNGNLDNARRLMRGLGMSFEDIKEKLVEVGLKGEKTWLEINTQIAGVAEAFKPGLVAVGAFGQAMGNLLNSGARGLEAVQAVRDIGVEAAEAQVKTFDQLRQQLLKTYDPKTVDAFFAALKQRGVGSIQELSDLSDEKAGSIVGDMQAMGVKFTDTGARVTDGLTANTSSTDENTRALQDNTRAQGGKVSETAAPDAPNAPEETFAVGGVVHGPTRALMGENGPEAILPLTRRNGKLGVAMFGGISSNNGGGGYVIHIDARGAAPGVEKSIRSALRTSEKRVVEAVGRNSRRNARRTT
jgi:hypothetical protein